MAMAKKKHPDRFKLYRFAEGVLQKPMPHILP